MLKKLGIIGGGQLGKMLTQEAKRLGFYVTVLDPTMRSPAGQIADEQIVSDFFNENKLREIVSKSDITTYEIENCNASFLEKLSDEGHLIHPSPFVLETIQDKSKQKKIFDENNIPTAKWKKINNNIEEVLIELGKPAVQKSCIGGYDGRGVFIIRDKKDIVNAIKSDSFIEEFIDFEKELAIMVARDANGEVKCHTLTEMIFDRRANICDMIIAPARVSRDIQKTAAEIAERCVQSFGGVGIFGVEMFLTKDDKILVNEIAPRPHNSGHYTLEVSLTSQFEQHIRAITGLPLGSANLYSPAVMVNILGEEGYSGIPKFIGLKEMLEIEGVNLYIYGKKTTSPFRKMGHITIVDECVENAIKKANKVKQIVKVRS